MLAYSATAMEAKLGTWVSLIVRFKEKQSRSIVW